MKEKMRLDKAMLGRKLSDSREKAQAMIMSGIVYVDGQKACKAGMPVTDENMIEIRGSSLKYVSRGGLKLEKALNVFPVEVSGKIAIDIGASTGGFTDCLLQNGAAHVYSIDVGYGQLAWSVRTDPRVTVMERTNIRYVTPDMLKSCAQLAVIDVSFISLRLVLPAVKKLIEPDGEVICLIKPQFEAGRDKVGKKGVVRDPSVHTEVIYEFIKTAQSNGFCVCAIDYSPVKGPEGNIEYLGYLCADNKAGTDIIINVEDTVERSHTEHDKI